jgi:hypothetical protein
MLCSGWRGLFSEEALRTLLELMEKLPREKGRTARLFTVATRYRELTFLDFFLSRK